MYVEVHVWLPQSFFLFCDELKTIFGWNHCEYLRLRPNSWEPVKCTQALIVCRGDYSWHSNNNYLLQKCPNARSQTHQVVIEALLHFKGRSLIIAPNTWQEKRYFCVLVCCTVFSRVVLKEISKNGWIEYSMLWSAFLTSKAGKILLNLYLNHQISLNANLAKITL